MSSHRVRLGTLNLRRTNTAAQVTADLDLLHHWWDVGGLQEVEEAAVEPFRRWRKRHRATFGMYRPKRAMGAIPVVWRKAVFRPIRGRTYSRRTHRGRRGVSPARGVVGRGLRHRATGTRWLVLNTHAVNAYTKNRSPQRWRDTQAEAHWLTVLAVAAEHVASGRWDVVCLVGDFNATWYADAEWWYPGPLLGGLFSSGTPGKASIDHLLVARGSGTHTRARYRRIPAKSDHALQIRVLSPPD